MNTQDKELLLKDLCARLPYGVIVHFDGWNPEKLTDIDLHTMVVNGIGGLPIPYLRPMSSMTEDEKKVYHKLLQMSVTVIEPNSVRKVPMYIVDLEDDGDGLNHLYDWFNENHFDYRGLIPMGLALEAPEGMYKTE